MADQKPSREKSSPVSDQMKAWSAALSAELRQWPQITQQSFFGFTALYRGRTMFGLLPRTRCIFADHAVAFRIERPNRNVKALLEQDLRIDAFDKDRQRWYTFEVSCDGDLHDALDWLARAFQLARISRKTS